MAEQARKAVQALKEKNLKLLSGLALPDKGIRFSPYGFVDTRNDLVFKPEQLKELFTVKTIYEWGVYDGSGEPIRLTFADYYAKFIYDADFAKAHQTAVNRQIGQGTTRSNLTEVYPPDRYSFVEFHFEGFEAQFEGLTGGVCGSFLKKTITFGNWSGSFTTSGLYNRRDGCGRPFFCCAEIFMKAVVAPEANLI